jgi:hypothetical protein
MSRSNMLLPNTTLNLVSGKELEKRLMMLRPIENYVLRCPFSSPESNVVIAALTTWLQTPQAHNVQTHPYAALVTHIQSTEENHLDMWRQLDLSPMAWERLWTAIRMIKTHGPPKTITVRAGTVVTVLSPDAHPPAPKGTSEKLVMHMRAGLSDPRIDWTNIVPLQDRAQYELAVRQHADSSAGVPDQGCV